MQQIIDFTNNKKIINKYSGADTKKTIIYNSKYYLLKFPNYAKQNNQASYSNNIFSEYIGCHIFNCIGVKAQNTILGIYKQDENKKQEIKEFFWNIFIIDALIGNYDRHNGNWGILVNDISEEIKMAPVYDCGSCLCSQLTDEQIEDILNSKAEINDRIYNKPTSAITDNGKRINYYEYISSLKNQDCNDALKRIVPKIDIDILNELINDVPFISDVRKSFYKVLLKGRYEIILKCSYDKLGGK